MRKIVIHKPGGHERLVIEEHPTPDPGPGEVLIEVEAIGVNYADCMVRMGLYYDWWRTPRFDPLRMTNANRGVLGFNLSYLFAETELLGEVMDRLLGWLDDGRVVPPPVETYRFEDVASAHKAIESGRTIGKLVAGVASLRTLLPAPCPGSRACRHIRRADRRFVTPAGISL